MRVKKPKENYIRQEFDNLATESELRPQLLKNCIRAFFVGGLICDIGELILNILASFGIDQNEAGIITSIILVFLGALLTGVGIYDKIANYAGAGTIVPITGFSNAIVAPAIEFKTEGFVFGVAAKMFTIAGPVLVYGIGSSVIVGIIYYLFII